MICTTNNPFILNIVSKVMLTCRVHISKRTGRSYQVHPCLPIELTRVPIQEYFLLFRLCGAVITDEFPREPTHVEDYGMAWRSGGRRCLRTLARRTNERHATVGEPTDSSMSLNM